jgi:lysophospholipase L1-like esterase
MKYFKIIVPFLVFFLFLTAFEYASFLYLSSTNEAVSSKDNEAQQKSWQNANGNESYTELDPLLGWSINQEESSKYRYIELANCFIFSTKNGECEDPLKIYISGGSTSDVVYDQENWPKSLFNLLEEQNICAEVYVAAVAGYSSGQELLKLIQDLNKLQPDYHISYSGANEMGNASYVTDYELNNYKRMIASPPVLPNSLTLLNKLIFNKPFNGINYPEKSEAPTFWAGNMKMMDGIAKSYDHQFIGILQPVFKFEEHIENPSNKILHYYANEYIRFYPEARKVCASQAYLFDLSRLFNTTPNEVFKDDCHLNNVGHQKIVAKHIYELIQMEGNSGE